MNQPLADMHRFLETFNRRPGATEEAIDAGQRQLNATFPAEYVAFLRLSDGGEGLIGKDAYVIFWSVGELAEMNGSYHVQTYAPGLLIFGSDGGGEAYGFDTRVQPWPIVQVPFVGMDWHDALPAGESFIAFLENLYEDE